MPVKYIVSIFAAALIGYSISNTSRANHDARGHWTSKSGGQSNLTSFSKHMSRKSIALGRWPRQETAGVSIF